MYTITYIHKDSAAELPLYLPGDTAYCLTDASLSLEVGAAGELSISIPDANPAKSDFVCLTDEILVYRDGAELWRGRAITRQEDFYRTGTLTCEGVLAYLYDTYYPPFEFSGSPTDFLSAVLDNHNAQVEERKQLHLGTVTVEDNNDYIARSSIEYNRTLTVLTDKLINDSLGGYFRVRIVDGVKYLDYLASYGTTATQPVEFGVNLLDIAQNVEYSDLATVILPLGAKLEDSDGNQTDEYLTIASANGGSIYYADETAVEEYGWIVVCNIWEDVTEASNLLTKAINYLAQVTSAVSSFEVSAVDLALVSAEYDYINLGDYVLIRSDPHGINQYVELTAMDIDLLDPSNDTLTFGADSASLTDAQRSSDRNVQTALESLSARYTNLVATAITTDYLTAKYITADDIAALYVKADNLEVEVAAFGYLTADNAKLTYATIDDLDATTANINDLTADVASINSLLAGNIGTGTVQTVHLTADNVVIDDAIITDAMIADLSASKLTAGTIYTSLIRIANDTGENLLIDGATLQVKDTNSVVRVQIGKDTAGDYNLALWDSSGTLLWDASGVYAAGLHDGIIRDIAVADDANISGYKLDISSVASCLNEDGSLVVDAAQVTIDNTTLDYKLTTITDNTDAAQAAAEAAQAAAVAAQSTADDAAATAATAASDAATAQSTADAAKSAADTAQSAADTAQADATAAQSAADAAATAASTAASDAAAAQSIADSAATAAANAQATADAAASDLTQAQADLKTAQDNYAALAAQANATDEELAAAQDAIAAAQSAVDTAQSTADAASKAAATAQSAANAAQADADSAASAATAAANAAATAQSTANTAKANAATAQSAADAAQADAEAAQSTADTAKANAATAQAAAKAAQSTADDAAAAAAELETRTTTLETELSVVQGQITAKVWQTDIDTAISGISIGSRNYLPNTRTMDGWTKSSNVTLAEDDEGYTVATFAAVSTVAWNNITSRDPIQFSLIRGQTVTISLDARSDECEDLNAETNYGLFVVLALCSADSTTRTLHIDKKLYTTELSDEWQRISYTVTASDDNFDQGSGDIDSTTRCYLQIFNHSVYAMQIRKVKLEIGNVATDWTPAPEDTETAITTLQDKYSAITQTVDGITTEVADLTTVVSDNYETLEGKITTVETTASGIAARVTQTESDISDNTASITTLSSEVTQLADSIALCVTTDADTGYLRLGAGDDGTVKFTVDSANLTIDEDGNATFSGALEAATGSFSGEITGSDITIIGDAAVGTRRIYTYAGDETNRAGGLVMYTESAGDAVASVDLTQGIATITGDMGIALVGNTTVNGFPVPRMQWGSKSMSCTGGSTVSADITFDIAFSGTPRVFVNPRTSTPGTRQAAARDASSTGFTLYIYSASVTGTCTVDWVAVYG